MKFSGSVKLPPDTVTECEVVGTVALAGRVFKSAAPATDKLTKKPNFFPCFIPGKNMNPQRNVNVFLST